MRAFLGRFQRIVLATFLVAGLAACKAEIYSNVTERDANNMISALSQSGITATRDKGKNGTFSVSVDRSDMPSALAILNQLGLPRPTFETLGNVFDSKKMVSTPFEERARFMYAINQELAHSITRIEGVVSARVHVMLPEASPFDRDQKAPRASVFVYHQPATNISQYVPVIKNLVVNAINGLNYEDVAVATFPTNAEVYSRQGGPGILRDGNYTALIVLGAVLLGMLTFRQRIGHLMNRVLARS